MTVIFGGAYQGKLAFAKRRFSLAESDIFYCDEASAEVDCSRRALCGLHLLFLAQTRRGESSVVWVQHMLPQLTHSILLCDDISCGVVPADPALRLWREETGRALALLCRNAQEVYRLFCGLETRLS